MKTKIFAASLIIALLAIFANVQNASAADEVKTGYIASLTKLANGGDGHVTAAEADKMAAAGSPLVFVSGKTVYFVVGEDGSYISKLLAKKADMSELQMRCRTKKVKGLNVLIFLEFVK